MPPITTMASSSPENATEMGSAEVMRLLNSSRQPASPVSVADSDEGDQFVAVGGVADELRALLVLADGDQHVTRRRTMKAPKQVHDHEGNDRDQP